MNRIRRSTLACAVVLLLLSGFFAPYLTRPWLDTLVITLLPIGVAGLIISLVLWLYYLARKRLSPPALGLGFWFALSAGAPFLGWLIGNQVFEPEAKWKIFVYNASDNGLSHKQMGTYVSADGCRMAGRGFLALPTRLDIPGCTGKSCQADHFMCGLDCGIDPEHDSSFISGFICKAQFDEDIMLGL